MSEERAKMYELIKEKGIYKQDVFDNTKRVFNLFKEGLEKCIDDICSDCGINDSRVEFYYRDKGEFNVEVKIAGDILVFFMHTNVFQIDRSNGIWRSSYVKEDENRAYVGVINIYNFLADSFKYNRNHDRGYLIGRVFVNKENHFMVQGKRQMGFLFNDFINSSIDATVVEKVIESAIMYTVSFDLLAPPYEALQEVTIDQIHALSNDISVETGKRLGFKFSFDEDNFE